jgi:hypothetical protein
MEIHTLQDAADAAEAQQELLELMKRPSKRNSPLITLLAAALKRRQKFQPCIYPRNRSL